MALQQKQEMIRLPINDIHTLSISFCGCHVTETHQIYISGYTEVYFLYVSENLNKELKTWVNNSMTQFINSLFLDNCRHTCRLCIHIGNRKRYQQIPP